MPNRISWRPVILSVVFVVVALFANYYASVYATERANNPVTDIVLSNIPLFDVDGMFAYGPYVMWAFVAYLLYKKPSRIPFTLNSVGLLIFVRAAFVTLTHLGPFPTHNIIDPNIFNFLSSGNDLFFSGHTGLPFMLALVFWKHKFSRIVFLLSSAFFGTLALLGHFHYSIDVLAAFFITYSVYHASIAVFKKDYRHFMLTEQGLPSNPAP
jgi:hypothetical protein